MHAEKISLHPETRCEYCKRNANILKEGQINVKLTVDGQQHIFSLLLKKKVCMSCIKMTETALYLLEFTLDIHSTENIHIYRRLLEKIFILPLEFYSWCDAVMGKIVNTKEVQNASN